MTMSRASIPKQVSAGRKKMANMKSAKRVITKPRRSPSRVQYTTPVKPRTNEAPAPRPISTMPVRQQPIGRPTPVKPRPTFTGRSTVGKTVKNAGTTPPRNPRTRSRFATGGKVSASRGAKRLAKGGMAKKGC